MLHTVALVPIALFALGVFGLPVVAHAQSTTEILRGRVLGGDSLPIVGAEVVVTGLATGASLSARTDRSGVYTALFQNPEGDYFVTVRKIGYRPVTFRARRTGVSGVLTNNVKLETSPLLLDSVTVASGRTLADLGVHPSIGGLDRDALSGALFLFDPSNLLALALTVPGVTAVGDSAYSVFGVSSGQNIGTLDGAKFSGASVPRDAIAGSSVVTTSADPARGGFAGGLQATTFKGGPEIFAANARGNFSNPTLSWADKDWPQAVPRNMGFSGSAGGPIRARKSHYLFAWDLSDNSASTFTLLQPRASLLSQAGILGDTVSALTSTLQQLGIPITASSLPSDRDQRKYNTSLVIDVTPSATMSLRLAHTGAWNINGGPNVGLNGYPSVSRHNYNTNQFFSGKLSEYSHGLLDELTASVQWFNGHNDSYVLLPSATVRVGTSFADGRTGLTNLIFAGSPGGGPRLNASGDVSIQDEISWLTRDSRHKFKVGGSFEYDWQNFLDHGNNFGSYSYQSLSDLAANLPSSYTRTLDAVAHPGHGNVAAGWIGDEWLPSKALQFQGGIRLDAVMPGTTPAYNSTVDSLFGLRTDRVPTDVGLSPRLGFSWSSPARRGRGPGLSSFDPSALALPQNAAQRAAALPGFVVSGAIGMYRGFTDLNRIVGLTDETGLPNTRRILSCVGAAVPIPNWQTVAGLPPDACLDGTAPSTFSATQPNIEVFQAGYHAQGRWTGNLGIDGVRVRKWVLGLTTVASYGVNGESTPDLNLNRTPRFMLSDGDRPVYVSPGSILASTGEIAPGASRIHPEFGSVTANKSELNSEFQQLQATLAPPHPLFNNKVSLALTYTLSRSRSELLGFNSAKGTAGDPFVKEWFPGSQPTHQFTLTSGIRAWWFNLQVRANIYSGFAFTPLVSGDINGDGVANNDRPFIANPAATADSSLAAQMTQLLATTTPGARKCLTSQFGKIAGAGSCRTEWQARIDLNLNFQPPSNWGYGDRLHFSMTTLNSSGALVRLLGLQDTPLGRSTLGTSPNPTLLYVTGFDPATQRFQYRVNQLFGEPSNFESARHRFPPFQVQLGVEYKLGGPPTSPLARSMGLLPNGKAPAPTEAQIRQRIAARLRQEPVAAILQREDSLALTKDQVDKLQALNSEFSAKADSVIAPIVAFALKKGTRITDADLSPMLLKAQPVMIKLIADVTTRAKAILTTAQRDQLQRLSPSASAASDGGGRGAGRGGGRGGGGGG